MKIVLDLQALQGVSRNRGLGRYSLHLAEALVQARLGWEWILLLHGGGSGEGLAEIRADLSRRLPHARIVVFDAPWPWDVADHTSTSAHRRAEDVRERLIDDLAPDIVLVCSLFEASDESVISIRPREGRISAAISYDVLPLTDSQSRPEAGLPVVYKHRLESLRAADLLLSISDYSAGEIRLALGDPLPPIETIWGAPVPMRPTVDPPARRGVLCVGGDTPRKNERSTIEAFSRLPLDLRRRHPLTISGRRRDSEVATLWAYARSCGLDEAELRVVGAELTDQALANLYRASRLVVMPSLGEGLGLPVLEAWSVGTPVIASNTTSLAELVNDERFSFDPGDPSSQADVLLRCLSDERMLEQATEFGARRLEQFTWAATADRALARIGDMLPMLRGTEPLVAQPSLALHTPWPPQQSGIARHAEVLLPSLERHYRVTVVNDDPFATRALTDGGRRVISTDQFLRCSDDFDRVLYNMGNNRDFHSMAVHAMGLVPGVVVAHDLDLVGLLRSCTPPLPVNEACSRFSEGGIRGLLDWTRPVGIDSMRTARGVVVHSDSAKRQLVSGSPNPLAADRVEVAPLVVNSKEVADRQVARQRLGVPEEDLLVCAFGRVFPEKRIYVAWEAVERVRSTGLGVTFRAVGGGDPDYMERLAQMHPESGELVGAVSDEEYSLWLSACDVAIQLRAVNRGETSGSLVEALAFGCQVIVEGVGSFSEFAQFGAHVVSSPANVDEVAQALRMTLTAVTPGPEKGEEALLSEFRSLHSADGVANSYAAAIERFYRVSPRESRFDSRQAASVARNLSRLSATRPTIYWADSVPAGTRGPQCETASSYLLNALVRYSPGRVMPVRVDGPDPVIDLAALQHLVHDASGTDLEDYPTAVTVRDGDWLVLPQPTEQNRLTGASLRAWRGLGGRIATLISDLTPLDLEDFFPRMAGELPQWLSTVLSESDVIVTPSDAVRERLDRWLRSVALPSPGGEIVTIPSGYDLDGSMRPPAELLGRPVGNRRVLVVGDAGPVSAFMLVANAVSALRQSGHVIDLVLAGGSPASDVEYLTALKTSAPGPVWLRNPSHLELRWEYLNADLLVMAGRGDGIGLPALEALAYGVPVLARDLPGMRGLLGESVRYFSLDGDLPDAIVRCLSAPERCEHDVQLVTWQESAEMLLVHLGIPGDVMNRSQAPVTPGL